MYLCTLYWLWVFAPSPRPPRYIPNNPRGVHVCHKTLIGPRRCIGAKLSVGNPSAPGNNGWFRMDSKSASVPCYYEVTVTRGFCLLPGFIMQSWRGFIASHLSLNGSQYAYHRKLVNILSQMQDITNPPCYPVRNILRPKAKYLTFWSSKMTMTFQNIQQIISS